MQIKILETPNYKKDSARAKWFAAIKRYDGKDVDAFVAATIKKPPVLTRSGDAEHPSGWVRFFAREEVVELAE